MNAVEDLYTCMQYTLYSILISQKLIQALVHIMWLADGDSLMCYIVRMSRLTV